MSHWEDYLVFVGAGSSVVAALTGFIPEKYAFIVLVISLFLKAVKDALAKEASKEDVSVSD